METHVKPAYVFVGGICHTPALFVDIITELASHGHDAACVAYPTVEDDSGRPMATKQADEIEAIREQVQGYLDKGKDVVLVCHSYGGIPGSRSVLGLDKEARLYAGHSSGIVEVVFLSSFTVPDNFEWTSSNPDWLTIEGDVRTPNEKCVPLLFSDLDAEAQRHWYSKLRPHTIEPGPRILGDAPWHLSVPKTYIILTEDMGATPKLQLTFLSNVIDKTWTVKSLACGHEAFVSQPKNLAKVLLQQGIA